MKTFLHKRKNNANRYDGVALVVTLLVIVVLTVAVTAFMQSMSLERRTSQAYLNILSTDEAIQAGLQKATDELVQQTANDYYTVVQVRDASATPVPYYFIGTPVDATIGTGELKVKYTPLFSYLNSPSLTVVPTPTASLPPITPPNAADAALNKPILSSTMAPVQTTWQKVSTGATNTPQIRYCYWMEDLSAGIDASVAGNVDGAGSTHARANGTDPKELALYSVFNPAVQTDPGNTAAKPLLAMRNLLLTPDTAQQIIATAVPAPSPTPTAAFLRDNLVSALGNDIEQNIIPFGFGYKEAGTAKKNLNTLITAKDVANIAKAITDNLPNFNTREGGLSASSAPIQDYNKTLAANIIDYVDTDSDATVGTGYRGVDSYPFITELYTEYKWVSSTTSGGKRTHTVTTTNWLEVWNMSNKNVTGTLEFEDINKQTITFGEANYTFDNTVPPTNNPAPPTSVSGLPLVAQAINLSANQYQVIKMSTTTYTFESVAFAASPVSLPAHTNSSYKYYWKNSASSTKTLVDEARGGLDRASSNLAINGNPVWKGAAPGFVYSTLNANYYDNVGDPRSSIYNTQPQSPISYTAGASMGYRNYRKNVATRSFGEVKFSLWSDGGHETGEPTPPNPPTVTTEPTVGTGTSYTDNAPSIISNSGTLASTTELNNIFDPGRWKDTSQTTKTTPASDDYIGFIGDLPDSPSAVADAGYGGGYTLRIGRAEHPKFDKPGLRASQLLDLFATTDRTPTKGFINLNTASYDVLRSLAAGMKMQRDPGMTPSPSTSPQYPPKITDEADVFAKAVIAGRPYISSAQLSGLKDTTGPVFGNANRYTTPAPSTWLWNDSAREEFFSRLYSLTTVRSRNFRIFVTAQVLNKQGKVTSTGSKVFQVYLNPTRDAAGKITSQRVQIIYEKNL